MGWRRAWLGGRRLRRGERDRGERDGRAESSVRWFGLFEAWHGVWVCQVSNTDGKQREIYGSKEVSLLYH